MRELVFIFETMECDWDGFKVIRGVFSQAEEAVKYIKDNYYLLKDDNGGDICILDYSVKGDVFRQYGYEFHPEDVLEDDDGLSYWVEHYEDGVEENWREYLNTQTVFTLRAVLLDELIGFEERMHNTNEAKTNELGYTERSSCKENLIPMNTLGSLVLKYGDSEFRCGTGFSDAQRKEIWENKESYLGKLASIRYMSVGQAILPRIPSFQGFRDKDDM